MMFKAVNLIYIPTVTFNLFLWQSTYEVLTVFWDNTNFCFLNELTTILKQCNFF